MRIIVIGACNVDIVGKSAEHYISDTSNIGRVSISVGGVGRNIAHRLSRLGNGVELITAISESFFGELIEASLFNSDIGFMHAIKGDFEDSFYLSLEESNGEMIGAVNQMDSVNQLTPQRVEKELNELMPCDMIVSDANLPVETLEMIAHFKKNIPLAVEGVSVQKVRKLMGILDRIDLLKVNELEARTLVATNESCSPQDLIKKLMVLGVKTVHMTRGSEGVCIGYESNVTSFQAEKIEKVSSVNKAGDEYFAGIIHSCLRGDSLKDQVAFAQKLVRESLTGDE